MVDYEMDEVCSACGAPAGEPCRPDCTGICCDTGETQEVKALRSEVARLRHALDECRAAMREANDLTSLAMSEGLRQCDHMRVRLKVNAKKRRGLKYALACALRGIKRSDERTSKYARKWFFASDVARLAMSEGLRAVEQEAAEADALSDALAVARGKASRLVEAARGVVSSCGMSTSPHYVAVPVGRVDELSAALAAWEKG